MYQAEIVFFIEEFKKLCFIQNKWQIDFWAFKANNQIKNSRAGSKKKHICFLFYLDFIFSVHLFSFLLQTKKIIFLIQNKKHMLFIFIIVVVVVYSLFPLFKYKKWCIIDFKGLISDCMQNLNNLYFPDFYKLKKYWNIISLADDTLENANNWLERFKFFKWWFSI